MARLHGAGGYVNFSSNGTQDAAINQWTADLQQRVFDVSSFDNESNAKDKIGGTHKLVGTLSGWIDAAAIPTIAEMQDTAVGTSKIGHIELVATGGSDGTIGYECDAKVFNIQCGSEKTGMTSFTANFRSVGAITTPRVP